MSHNHRRRPYPVAPATASWMDAEELVKRQSSVQGHFKNDSLSQSQKTQTTSMILDSSVRNLAKAGSGEDGKKISKTQTSAESTTTKFSSSSPTSSFSTHTKEKKTETSTTTHPSTSSERKSQGKQVKPTPAPASAVNSSLSSPKSSSISQSSTSVGKVSTPSVRRKVVTEPLTTTTLLFAPASSLTAQTMALTEAIQFDSTISPSGNFLIAASTVSVSTRTKRKCSRTSEATAVPAAASATATADVGAAGISAASSSSSPASSSSSDSSPSPGRNAVIAGSVVGASVALALLALLIILYRRGKIREANFPTIKSPFTSFHPRGIRVTSPFPNLSVSSPLGRFQFPWSKAKSPVIPSPRAETYDTINRQSEKPSTLPSPRQSSETSVRDRMSEEVLDIDPTFMRQLSPVQEEGSSVYSSEPRSTLPYPESILTRSSNVMPSARSSGLLPSARSSSSRTILLPPAVPTNPRRASDPLSPFPSESMATMAGPWRDSMWSVAAMTPSGITPRTSVYPTNRPGSAHRTSKSLSAAYDYPMPPTIPAEYGSNAQSPIGGGSSPLGGGSGAHPTHQRHRAVPRIPSLFLGEQGATMGSTGNSWAGDEMTQSSQMSQGLPSGLPNGQVRRQNSGSTTGTMATPMVFREHPGNLVHF